MPDTKADQKQCRKCENSLDTNGYPLWCKACRARYKAEYQSLQEQMRETRGFCAGIAAMREYLAVEFAKYGPLQTWNGQSIAKIIRDCAGPQLPSAED